MIGRLTRAADFERLLATPIRQRSAHFAVHYVNSAPSRPRGRRSATELSTDGGRARPEPVDDLAPRRWLGCVVPKRLAKRAVTRNTLERQIRAAAERHVGDLPAGLWLVRLRQPFARAAFPSANLTALRAAVHSELDRLFAPATARAHAVPPAGGAQ